MFSENDVVKDAPILGDPGADSGARESQNGPKKAKKSLGKILPPLFFSFLVPIFPRATVYPWVSEHGTPQDAIETLHDVRHMTADLIQAREQDKQV